jgi:hypothetical protein
VKAERGPSEQRMGPALYTDQSKASVILDTPVREIEDFLRGKEHSMPLTEWWGEDQLDFVEKFYEDYAPEEYKSIYLANISILRNTSNIREDMHYGRNCADKSDYDQVCKAMIALKRGILSADRLNENYEYIKEASHLVEDVFLTLSNSPRNSISTGQQTALDRLTTFYRDTVWLMIAYSMSHDSAAGPNANVVRSRALSKTQEIRSSFFEELSENKAICNSVGLLPDIEDYDQSSEESEEFEDKLGEFMSVVDGRAN